MCNETQLHLIEKCKLGRDMFSLPSNFYLAIPEVEKIGSSGSHTEPIATAISTIIPKASSRKPRMLKQFHFQVILWRHSCTHSKTEGTQEDTFKNVHAFTYKNLEMI
jgi:hypothetical protein